MSGLTSDKQNSKQDNMNDTEENGYEQYKRKLEEKQKILERSIEELNREKKILDVLSIDYTAVYYCDLIEDTIIAIKQGDDTNAAVTESRISTNLQVYSFRIKYYAEHFVIKESAPDFEYKLSADYLMKYLAKNKRFAYRFRTLPNPAGQQYFEVQIARVDEMDGFKVVMGYRYMDDIIEEEERRKSELENALAQANLKTEIVDSLSKIYWLIYRLDIKTGIYEEISASLETHRLTGKTGSAKEVFKEACQTIVSGEHRDMMEKFWDLLTLQERMSDTESISIEYHTTSGEWQEARFIVKKRDNAGLVTNVLYVVRKITKEKQLEIEYKQKLLDTAQEAYRANMAKTDFLRRMSHDIRTPINGILGMIAIAERCPDDVQKLMNCRKKMKEAAGFLLDLVNNVLDMNKLESGTVILEHKPFDLRQVLKQTKNITEMNGENKELLIEYDNDNISHFKLIGSSLHLQQILQNIAGNAIKYTDAGGRIRLSCNEISCDNGTATYRFVCEDTGRGMSEEFLEHAFEPFAQEADDARTSYMGTGLGLAIARQLVEMMGGEIEVDSKVNVGTKFTITIPFNIDTSDTDDNDKKEEIPDSVLNGIRILLVEDNELNMDIAKFILEDNKMDVVTAMNGDEAVQIFKESEEGYFDFILMDIMMPVMNGIEAAKIIRGLKRKDAMTIPIFAMTANAFIDDMNMSREAGMNEHISKPLDEAVLKNTIKRYVVKNNIDKTDV